MPTPHAKRSTQRRKPRFKKVRPAAPKKKLPAPSREAVAKRRTAAHAQPGRKTSGRKTPGRKTPGGARRERLPGWSELAGAENARVPKRTKTHTVLDAVPTVRFAAFILALAAAFTLYVGHVHASQELLTDIQRLQRENLNLHLKHNRLKGAFDEITSPGQIYRRARALGLTEATTYGPTIEMER